MILSVKDVISGPVLVLRNAGHPYGMAEICANTIRNNGNVVLKTMLATKEEKVSRVYIWDISGVKVRDLCATIVAPRLDIMVHSKS